MEIERAEKMVDAMAAQLSEHFEAVQILATFPTKEGGTARICRGRGNWFARQGMAHSFVQSEQAEEIAAALKHNED